MREIAGQRSSNDVIGHWRVWVHPPYGAAKDITMFRGSPVELGEQGFTDPFGPEDMSIKLPQVSILEKLGFGDLDWARKDVNIDVVWDGPLPANYPFGHWVSTGPDSKQWVPQFRWEGYLTTFARSTSSGLTAQAKGAMFQLDHFQAKPEYTSRPIPYEWAIARMFLNRPSLRLSPLSIDWPEWWSLLYEAGDPELSYKIPAGVSDGQRWTGLTTRSTGSWDPVLTSYIQTLLTSMQSERGRWTMDLDAHRRPRLFHREYLIAPGPSVVTINPVSPGVEVDVTEDWDQTLTTIYGQGSSLSGVAYTGMSISADGAETTYHPLAYKRQVYPDSPDNRWMDSQVMARETLLQLQQGLSADDAGVVARAHLSRFATPGVVGTIRLTSDVLMDGQPLSRYLVRAGMAVHLPFYNGAPEGVMLHVSKSRTNQSSGEVTLTVDSKVRDSLTVEQVRLRGRDSLSVSRMLVAGQYQPPIPDQMFPWNYAEGSGYIPSSPSSSSMPLFSGMPDDVTFPWTDWTTQRPPKDARWANCYLKLGPASANANDNWITQDTVWGTAMGVPIRMSQAGSIRLLQIAAYDKHGNVMRVPFHVSFYGMGGVNVQSMPLIPAEQAPLFVPYSAGQHYPYVRDGWERFNIDGTRTNPNIPHPTESVGLLKAYGTFYEKAGFWPGSYAEGDAATGMLVDENVWQFDLTGIGDSSFDPYNSERNLTNPRAGQIYAMIYCDVQDEDVYFVGRMFRSEPGTGV